MSIGDTLRQERLRLDLDLDSLSKNTRIKREYLEAIEAGRPEACPGFFFYRSFVRQYAAALGLDPGALEAGIQGMRPAPVLVQGKAEEPFPLKAPDAFVRNSNRLYFANSGKVWGSVTVLVVAIVGCSLLYNWWRGRQTETLSARPPAASVEAPKKVTPPVAAPQPAPMPAAPAQSVSAPVATTDDHVVVAVTARERAWVSLSADAKPRISRTLEPGEMRTIGSADLVRLTVGNAGGVDVTLNGTSIGPVGPRGQVRVVVFTPEGFKILPPSGSVKPAPSDSTGDNGIQR